MVSCHTRVLNLPNGQLAHMGLLLWPLPKPILLHGQPSTHTPDNCTASLSSHIHGANAWEHPPDGLVQDVQEEVEIRKIYNLPKFLTFYLEE